jgi:hypothetical protein
MSDLYIWIDSGRGGLEVHKTQGGISCKSLGTCTLGRERSWDGHVFVHLHAEVGHLAVSAGRLVWVKAGTKYQYYKDLVHYAWREELKRSTSYKWAANCCWERNVYVIQLWRLLAAKSKPDVVWIQLGFVPLEFAWDHWGKTNQTT